MSTVDIERNFGVFYLWVDYSSRQALAKTALQRLFNGIYFNGKFIRSVVQATEAEAQGPGGDVELLILAVLTPMSLVSISCLPSETRTFGSLFSCYFLQNIRTVFLGNDCLFFRHDLRSINQYYAFVHMLYARVKCAAHIKIACTR